jgi:hypothetical protein
VSSVNGWRVRDEKRLIGFAQVLPGVPLVAYGLAGSELELRTTLLLMATVVSVLGLARVGLTALRLARGLEPAPDSVVLVSWLHVLARTVLPLLALYLGVAVWGTLGSGDPRTLLGFLGLFMVFDGAINLGQAAIVADWERRNPARLIRANHLLYLAQ